MSTDSLIANIDYNVKMDSNVSLSLNSNEGTLSPEDLSYIINITDNPINLLNEKIPVSNNVSNNISNNMSEHVCLIIKLNVLILSSIIILLCIIFL